MTFSLNDYFFLFNSKSTFWQNAKNEAAICQFFHIKVKAQFRASFKIWEQIEMKDNQYISKQYIEIKNIIFLPILQGDT